MDTFIEYITIKGIKYSTTQHMLDLSREDLRDRDIVPLKYMVNLDYLNLSNNQISDLAPLSDLTKLHLLNLGYNVISDLTPLSKLSNLDSLILWNNQISDVTPLAGLTKTKLYLNDNQISNITPLYGLYYRLGKQLVSDLPIEPESDTEWQKAYERVFRGENEQFEFYCNGSNGLNDEDGDSQARYAGLSLVDFDEDGVPELVIHILGYEGTIDEIYSYYNGSIYYSLVTSGLFKEMSSDYFFGNDCYGWDWIDAYKFENGAFNYVEDYAKIVYPEWDSVLDDDEYYTRATVRIGDSVFPLKEIDSIKGNEGFKSFYYSYSPDFDTAVDEYFARIN